MKEKRVRRRKKDGFRRSLSHLPPSLFPHFTRKQGHEELMKLLFEAAPETRSTRDARKGMTPEEALRVSSRK